MTDTADLVTLTKPGARVTALRQGLDSLTRGLRPLITWTRPYVDGIENLPGDGRFLLVGNHTQSGTEVYLIAEAIRSAIGTRVRPLADRKFGEMRGLPADLLAAFGVVVGSPETARELMRHDQTILVFPGGAREIAKFKGEEYTLRWQGRSGFARLSAEEHYPIVPVGLVGGDDVYRSITSRDDRWARMSAGLSRKMHGRNDMAMPLVHGIGPTLIPRPQRMYLRFGPPIDTTRPQDAEPGSWVDAVKERTELALQQILTDLLVVRSSDPYRSLNPLARMNAVTP